MSTLEDLMLDAQRETMLDRCDALHADEPEEGCPGCEERAQRLIEDAREEYEARELLDREGDASLVLSEGVVIARVRRIEL